MWASGKLVPSFIAVLGALLVAGADPSKLATHAWLILPRGAAGGAITAQTTEAELVRTYGRKNVLAQDIELGEGETEPGTALFPNDPARRLEILWKDVQGKRWPKRLQISGQKGLWRTVYGITLGTTLKELERLNRRPFLLTGFAWDYSGTVVSWRHGALEKDLGQPGRVLLRLDASAHDKRQPEYSSIQGDRGFSSGHPAMQRVNPHVYQIIWEFP